MVCLFVLFSFKQIMSTQSLQTLLCIVSPCIEEPLCGGTQDEVNKRHPPSPAAPQLHPPPQKVSSKAGPRQLCFRHRGGKFLPDFSAEPGGTREESRGKAV